MGLTGSNGKTTVKEMLASILREHTKDEVDDRPLSHRGRVGEGERPNEADSVLATQGNLNNDIGMPLTLLRLNAGHRYAVIEMGMNHPGEIDYLSRLASPDVAIINNASGAHLAGLGSVEGVARAKGEIFAGLRRRWHCGDQRATMPMRRCGANWPRAMPCLNSGSMVIPRCLANGSRRDLARTWRC